jgi:subtilase family serine protease
VRRVALTSATALTLGALAASAITASATGSTPMTRIAGNVLPNLAKVSSVAADPHAHMTIGVALAHPDTAGELALVQRMYTPGTPEFGHYLTADQVAARFGVAKSHTADIVNRLRKAGLTVSAPDAFGDYVNAEGTVAQVERAFAITERQFTVKGPKGKPLTFLANLTGPQVPVADQVVTVVGLNTLQRYSTAQDLCEQNVCTGDTTPEDLWDVYKEPTRYAGQGVTMAVIGEGNPKNLPGYLAHQEDKYSLPHTRITVKCVQRTCGSDTSGDGEWQIDTQASAGMAPHNAGLTLYFAKTILDGDLNNSFVAWAHDAKGPKLASASLGECESSPLNDVFTGPLGQFNGNTSSSPGAIIAFGNGEQAAIDPVLRSAVLQGKTLFASTGDTGSSCPLVYLPLVGAGNGVLNQGLPEQNYPAVSVSAVAVGGTVLYTADNKSGAGSSYHRPNGHTSRVAETVWPFGGGGASLWTPAPSWQRKVAAINQPCIVPNGGAAPGTVCRGVPDVAAQSGDILTNGYSVYGSGGFTSGGGTSLSSPLWMGMWARVQGAAGHNLGFAAPLLYRMGSNATTYARDFYDVTVGGNGIHVATTGWDYTTGWGAPNVAGLIADIAHKH